MSEQLIAFLKQYYGKAVTLLVSFNNSVGLSPMQVEVTGPAKASIAGADNVVIKTSTGKIHRVMHIDEAKVYLSGDVTDIEVTDWDKGVLDA